MVQKQAKFCVVQTGPEAKRYVDSCIIIMEVHWSEEDIISYTYQRWECSPRFDAQMQPHWRHLTAVLCSVLLFLKTLNAFVGGNSPGAVVCGKGFPSSTSVLELTLSSLEMLMTLRRYRRWNWLSSKMGEDHCYLKNKYHMLSVNFALFFIFVL